MGEPWVSDLFLDGIFISSNANIDNTILEASASKLFFIKYHAISKWQNDNYFTINYLDLNRNRLYEFEQKFEKIFLGKFIS